MISHFLEKTHGKNIKISRKLISNTKAFTLIELMVTVGIFVLMTALILARYNSYYSGTVFTNMAYDVALTMRQAQTYGISVKATTGVDFTGSYGVNFLHSSPNNEFSLYSYTKSNDPAKVTKEKSYTLKRGAKINSLCVGVNQAKCTSILSSGDELDIVFQRPNPEPIICLTYTSGGSRIKNCTTYKYAKIELIASDGSTKKSIVVDSTGQISIE
jgi:Tfp pilus assembly protein FimT